MHSNILEYVLFEDCSQQKPIIVSVLKFRSGSDGLRFSQRSDKLCRKTKIYKKYKKKSTIVIISVVLFGEEISASVLNVSKF
jgi:hypothetical protein